jgi:hypothetical protein
MVYRTRIKYTAAQKAEMWDRWQRGESMNAIGRVFDRHSTSIFGLLAPSGGIRPPPRQRSRLALTVAEREEISRGLAIDQHGRVQERRAENPTYIKDQTPGSKAQIKQITSTADTRAKESRINIRSKPKHNKQVK